MMKYILSILLAAYSISGAHAQALDPQTLHIALEPIPCTGLGGNNQMYYLENFVKGVLPDKIYITKAKLWIDGSTAIGVDGVNHNGNIAVGLDPQSGYAARMQASAAGGWLEPLDINTLVILEMKPDGPKQAYETHSPPFIYRPGDSILVAPECTGRLINGAWVAGNPIIAGFLIITYYVTDPAPPPPVTLLNVPLTKSASNAGTFSIRNVVPAASASFTKVRAQVVNIGGCTLPTWTVSCVSNEYIAHMDVCIRDGSTSNCVDDPVKMTFGGGFGKGFDYYLYTGQWANTDWTPLVVAAGQELLITSTIKNPPGDIWPLSEAGFGGWWMTGDSAGAKDFAGTWHATRTQVFTKVEAR